MKRNIIKFYFKMNRGYALNISFLNEVKIIPFVIYLICALNQNRKNRIVADLDYIENLSKGSNDTI